MGGEHSVEQTEDKGVYAAEACRESSFSLGRFFEAKHLQDRQWCVRKPLQ